MRLLVYKSANEPSYEILVLITSERETLYPLLSTDSTVEDPSQHD